MQKRLMLLSLAVKIQQLLIIMHYRPSTTNDPAHRYRVCVRTALPTVDSITSATLRSCCICFHCLIILTKRMDTYNSKGGG